jgi:biotin--protein ligase
MKIYIYNGEGVGPRATAQALRFISRLRPLYTVETINANAIINGEWHSSARLLIIPGGRDIPYHNALQGAGNRAIRSFVEAGGAYLGLCAGAYYGCASVDFDRGGPLEVLATRELAFYRGAAIGPAYGVGTFIYDSDAGARASLIDWAGEQRQVYYDGGCYFSGEDPNMTVLSRYQDIESHPPAIIECRVGQGKAILSGVHPEFGADAIGARYQTPEVVVTALQKREQDADIVLNGILQRLGV